MPAVVCVGPRRPHRAVPVRIFAVETNIQIVSDARSVTNTSYTLQLVGSTARLYQPPASIFRLPGNDVDHSIDCVRAPYRRARTADHFDPVDVVEQSVLHIPEHSGVQGRIHSPAIN